MVDTTKKLYIVLIVRTKSDGKTSGCETLMFISYVPLVNFVNWKLIMWLLLYKNILYELKNRLNLIDIRLKLLTTILSSFSAPILVEDCINKLSKICIGFLF